jgi:hypothetical protein
MGYQPMGSMPSKLPLNTNLLFQAGQGMAGANRASAGGALRFAHVGMLGPSIYADRQRAAIQQHNIQTGRNFADMQNAMWANKNMCCGGQPEPSAMEKIMIGMNLATGGLALTKGIADLVSVNSKHDAPPDTSVNLKTGFPNVNSNPGDVQNPSANFGNDYPAELKNYDNVKTSFAELIKLEGQVKTEKAGVIAQHGNNNDTITTSEQIKTDDVEFKFEEFLGDNGITLDTKKLKLTSLDPNAKDEDNIATLQKDIDKISSFVNIDLSQAKAKLNTELQHLNIGQYQPQIAGLEAQVAGLEADLKKTPVPKGTEDALGKAKDALGKAEGKRDKLNSSIKELKSLETQCAAKMKEIQNRKTTLENAVKFEKELPDKAKKMAKAQDSALDEKIADVKKYDEKIAVVQADLSKASAKGDETDIAKYQKKLDDLIKLRGKTMEEANQLGISLEALRSTASSTLQIMHKGLKKTQKDALANLNKLGSQKGVSEDLNRATDHLLRIDDSETMAALNQMGTMSKEDLVATIKAVKKTGRFDGKGIGDYNTLAQGIVRGTGGTRAAILYKDALLNHVNIDELSDDEKRIIKEMISETGDTIVNKREIIEGLEILEKKLLESAAA